MVVLMMLVIRSGPICTPIVRTPGGAHASLPVLVAKIVSHGVGFVAGRQQTPVVPSGSNVLEWVEHQ